MNPERRTVRYAVMGLGHIAQVAVLPAFAHAKNSRLVHMGFPTFESCKPWWNRRIHAPAPTK